MTRSRNRRISAFGEEIRQFLDDEIITTANLGGERIGLELAFMALAARRHLIPSKVKQGRKAAAETGSIQEMPEFGTQINICTSGELPCESRLLDVEQGETMYIGTGILMVIPPVASPAGESGKPLGEGHLRVVLFAFALTEASR